jgi:hypothetical protein
MLVLFEITVLWLTVIVGIKNDKFGRFPSDAARYLMLEAPATLSVVRQSSCHFIDGKWVVTASFPVHAGTCTAASFFATT